MLPAPRPEPSLGQRLCRIATSGNAIGSPSRSIDSISLSRKGEDLRLDIERKRAMFPEHKISRPGFLRFVADIWRTTYGLSRCRHSAFRMVEDFHKTVTDPGSRKLSGGTADEDTRRSRVSGQEAA
jgi:hypothetical protein